MAPSLLYINTEEDSVLEFRRMFLAWVLMLASAFILKIHAPSQSEDVCDFVQNGLGQRVSWNSELPVKVHIHHSVPQRFRGAIKSAMRRWNHSYKRETLFQFMGMAEGENSPKKENNSVIYWKEQWSGEKVGEQARTTVFWKNNQISEADIQINAQDFDFAWEDEPVNKAVDFESLMVHELGHSLGLSHTSKKESVMLTRLSTGTFRRDPSKTDLSSLSCEY